MARWQRPSGPLIVWKIIDGYEKLKDGTRKLVKFSIQDIPDEEYRRKEFMDLLTAHFIRDEPMSKSLKLIDDPDGIHDFQTIWQYSLDQGINIACYQLDANGKIEKLIGANVIYIIDEQTKKDFDQIKKEFKSQKFRKIWNVCEKLGSLADVTKLYNVDKYIGSVSLSILPHYRGQKLGYHILNTRSDVAKKYGLAATCTVFTAEASQLQAKRSGFEEGYSIDYKDFVDDEGNPQFLNIESKSAKIMMKRLP